ncbi:PREDICTED: putative mediator of RNA polymerase II transcription subunit 17 [Bactrocera latifrons]|uniref:putative mediator of RNA polymerase II transcription subunit 17 n=1 Tax=Bactrocera latifrons TaxID=174628 RepID=UPI0008DC952B|nr:PREDICTED: putative mediator of RNA polymerase II transcription subunit 17 [Bactrocera latifrons]
MRAFIVLCLASVAFADKLGYNYHPVGHSDSGLSFAPGGSSGHGGLGGSGGLAGGGSPAIGGHSGGGASGLGTHGGSSLSGHGNSIGLGGLGAIGGTNGLGGIGGTNTGGNTGLSAGSSAPVAISPAAAVTYEKEFYTFSAPENEFNNDNAGPQISSVKKNLRVIFIKAPENKGLENAAVQLAKHSIEDKTAIYVLTKQPDIGNLAQQLQNTQSQQSHKPEVHFVKYRTPEDAANAQKAIQSEYDQLAGKSQAHNGGVAPVLNFASRAPVAEGPAPKAPANSYLPSSVLRLFRA